MLAASTWAVLALTCDIELFTQVHYRSSIDQETQIDPLWKDVFLFHFKEESQHAILDELEWARENERLDATEKALAVSDLIDLVALGTVADVVRLDQINRVFVEQGLARIRSGRAQPGGKGRPTHGVPRLVRAARASSRRCLRWVSTTS